MTMTRNSFQLGFSTAAGGDKTTLIPIAVQFVQKLIGTLVLTIIVFNNVISGKQQINGSVTSHQLLLSCHMTRKSSKI